MKTFVIFVLICSVKVDGFEKADPAQCTTKVDSNDGWSGTLSIKLADKCQVHTPLTWRIDNEPLLKINGTVTLKLIFINFTKEHENEINCEKTDTVDRIEVIEKIGVPTKVCRNESSNFTRYFTTHTDFRKSIFVRYMPDNTVSRRNLLFAIQYTFPDYPCFDCDSPDTCEEDRCLQSESKCPGLKEAFKCVENVCKSNPCKNNGTCTPLPADIQEYRCTCSEGFTGENCNNKICDDNMCKNGGRCRSKTDTSCECPPDVWGNMCEIRNDGTFCSPETDKYPGSGITWNGTKVNQTDEQPCLDANGTATRQCLSNQNTPVWAQPDLSRCVSPEFDRILTDVDTLMEAESVTLDALTNITNGVQEIIRQKTGKRMYAGDLTVATDTVEKVSRLVKRVNSERDVLENIAKGCGNAASSIIDPVTSHVWSFTKKGYLEDKITLILKSLEQLSKHVAEKTSNFKTGKTRRKRSANEEDDSSESFVISTANIDFTIHVLDRATNFSAYRNDGYDEQSSLILPMDVFDKAVTKTSDPYIHIFIGRLITVSSLLTDTNAIIQKTSTENLTGIVNSEIISSKVLNVPDNVFQALEKPVKLSFRLQDANLSSRLDHNCVFLNMSATSEEGRWLRQGCHRSSSESNSTYTVCYCSHLTNFAVLMDIYDVEDNIDDLDSKILTYFTYGGGAFSILGCIVSVIVFEFFRLRNERVRIHEQLALTIILVQLFFLIGIDRTENMYVCMAMAICLHYALVAMFCWMLIEGAHLYLVLVKVFKSKSYMKTYIAIGWGVPLIIVGISAGLFHNEYGIGPVCWLTKKVLLVAFVPAVGFVIVINTIVLIVVMRIMLKSLSKGSKTSSEERSSIKTSLKAAAVLLPLLGLTWTFGFLSITSKETLIFTYLFTLLNSLQGVFFFVFHCLLSADVQNAYDRHSRRKSQMQKTESSFSKKGTLKRNSDYSSSLYISSYSRNSLKTGTTDSGSPIERKRSNDYIPDSRQHSVAFDDDVFYEPSPSIHGSISSQTGRSPYRNIDPLPLGHYDNVDGYSHTGGHHTDGVLNNNVRTPGRKGSHSSQEYVLYYGKNSPGEYDLEHYHSFDKNELYAKVRK